VVIAGLGALLALLVVGVAPQVVAAVGAHDTDASPAIDLSPLAQRSVVLAADGSPIATLYRDENRKAVALRDLPDVVKRTVLAVEDAQFYEHGGVNLRSVGRALVSNVKAGDIEQGGSTITQQLVKNALVGTKRDLDRKLREAVLASRLEKQLTKDEILERYLNTVYLGNGAYGVEAASELYFGIPANELDLPRASIIAGLIRNPVGYDPFTKPDALRVRLGQVVQRLRASRAVSAEEARAIEEQPLPTQPAIVPPKPDDYFVDHVIQLLLEEPALGKDRAERYGALFRGGLTIKTTLDMKAQFAARAAITKNLPDTNGRFTSAVVSVEPGTGAVRALVGGAGFEQSKFNIVTDGIGRPVGSSFKPFVLAAALEQGISPKSTIAGAGPCTIPNPGGTPDPYKGENFEGERGGTENLYDATRHSLNCAFLRLGKIVGVDKVAEMATRLGVTTPIHPVLTTPIGVSEIRPLDMAAAYATLAAGGVRRDPYFVSEVRSSDGDVLLSHADEPKAVLKPEIAATVTDILRGVVDSGTGTAAKLPDRPVAGKTGTTDNFGDAWFVGYTPQLSTAVWMGSPIDRTPMRGIGGVARVAGGTFPARIWGAYMRVVTAGMPVQGFPAPPPAGKGTYLRAPGERAPAPLPAAKPSAATTTVPGPQPTPVPPTAPERLPKGPGKKGR
jgi:penicillin-binding protein 1A